VLGVTIEDYVFAIRRHAGWNSGAQLFGQAVAVCGLPEQTLGAIAQRKEDQMLPVRRPHRTLVPQGIERPLAELLACEIPHPDVEFLVLDGHCHMLPIRREARME